MSAKLNVPLSLRAKAGLKQYVYTHPFADYLYCSAYHFPIRVTMLKAELPKPRNGKTVIRHNFVFQTFGKKNPNKTLYLINIDQQMGLMSYFLETVEYLAISETFGFTPVIYWNAENYWRDCEKESGNVYDYYFCPGEISKQEALNSARVATYRAAHRIFETSTYVPDNSKRDIMYAHEIINCHMQLNHETDEYIQERIRSILCGKKTLGVHVRGSGYKLKYYAHAVAIDPTEHITEAKKAIATHGFERIFLATDEETTIALFKAEFGDMVATHTDIVRLKPEDSVPDSYMLTVELRDSRPDHGYLMGLEVLTDVYTLAACQGLIAGLSNIAVAAKFINGDKYEYSKIIHKGFYGVDVPFEPNEHNLNTL